MAISPRSLFEYLNDLDERPFLILAFDGKLDDTQRLAYAKVIEAKDPDRAEWLRLEVQLHSHPTSDTNVHRRYVELGRKAGYDFLKIIRRNDVFNCGKATNEPRRVRFSFVCDKRWETLHPTDTPDIRHCNICNERVHHCTTVREAETHARAGHCIAVANTLVEKATGNNYHNMVGRPDPIGDWSSKLFPSE